jgi:hypothetical protein
LSGSKVVWTILLALASTPACSSKPAPTPAEIDQAKTAASILVQEGYKLKQTGMNGAALERFERACRTLEQTLGAETEELASCLDDQASVHVRTGDHTKALELYYRALRIAGQGEGVDPRLLGGIRYRIGLLGRFEKLGIRCAEPAEPPAEAPLPYFPDVPAVQRVLGSLNPTVASCDSGLPRPVTVKVTITGDGVPIMAETRGADQGTAVGACLEERVIKAIPNLDLPRFGACFRAFTFPYAVGALPGR